MQNTLFKGNSLYTLDSIEKKSVNMIYLDPPFFTNRSFESATYDGKRIIFSDIWKNGITEYLEFMKKIFDGSLRILSDNGLLFLHCDWHAVHYLKVEMDRIFGYHNFVNEIIWKRHNSQNNSKQGSKIFGRMHDTILIYSKTKNYKWNQLYQKYSDNYVKRSYNKIDENGERYALGDLSGPGGSAKGNPKFEFMGVTRYWRYNKEKMKTLLREGKIIQTKPNTVPKLKRYLKDMKGVPLNDVWIDMHNHQTKNKQSIIYPTQKPVELLERIILCATDKTDVVLDPFCGSGTTIIAANNLKRKWIAIDDSYQAIQITRRRLADAGIKDDSYSFINTIQSQIINSKLKK